MRKFNITVVLKNHLHLENEISMFFIGRVITHQYFVWMKFKITMQNTSNWFMANFKFELPGLLVKVSITCLTILVVLTIFWRSSMIFCIILTAFSMFLTQLWTMFLEETAPCRLTLKFRRHCHIMVFLMKPSLLTYALYAKTRGLKDQLSIVTNVGCCKGNISDYPSPIIICRIIST